MKRIIQSFAMLLVVMLPTSVVAHDFEVDGIFYCISGNNAIVSYKGTAYQTSAYSGQVVIPESVTYNGRTYLVTEIGKNAFRDCTGLTSIIISNSITSIGSYAFYWCRSLTNVVLGNSVKFINNSAFRSCSSLAHIEIPNSVLKIEQSAFSSCTSLESFVIPSSVENIGNFVIYNCTSLKSIVVSTANQIYDSRDDCNAIIHSSSNTLIAGCHNTIIPNTIAVIGNGAFLECSLLTSIEIPNSVTQIGDSAFFECSNLKYINIPNSVTSVGIRAFKDCSSLIEIVIPNSITEIGQFAFNTSAQNIKISGVGDWQADEISCSCHTLWIDSRITSLKGISINPTNSVYCFSSTPPLCDNKSFSSYSSYLHVPDASIASYFTTNYWCNFTNILGGAIEPENININLSNVSVTVGSQFDLTASVEPNNSTYRALRWSTTDANVATVDNYGKVTTVGVGECDIIVQIFDIRAICHVVVNDTICIISLDQQEAMVLPNHIISLTPSTLPNTLSDLTVSSSDPSVAAARVMNGKVQVVGIKEGTTTISVSSEDGTAIPATCLVTVYTEPGDLNCDGFLTISDVTSIIDYLLSGDTENIKVENADVNGDGNISISDATTLIDILLSGE